MPTPAIAPRTGTDRRSSLQEKSLTRIFAKKINPKSGGFMNGEQTP